jgi:anaerobic selenocysteine-containing dehydrogenase
VRSMRAPRAKASERNATGATTNPAKSPHAEADGSTGLIRKRRKWARATSLMVEWGPGIERHPQGTDAAAAVSFLCITLGWGIGHAEPGYGCKAPYPVFPANGTASPKPTSPGSAANVRKGWNPDRPLPGTSLGNRTLLSIGPS